MNNTLFFTKMQGAGNDFIVLDNRDGRIPAPQYPQLAQQLCQRRISLGADGLMIVEQPRKGGDFAMVFYNADGTMGEMCGNGARCIARYGYDHGLAGDTQRIETTAGMVSAQRISADRYRIRLNDPTVLIPQFPVSAAGQQYECAYLELGNPGIPHAVVLLEDWDSRETVQLRKLGESLRLSSVFPKGANVTFWKKTGDNRVKAVTYERGVEDFTLACGTGAGSTAAALRLLGHTHSGETRLDFPGGTLWVSLSEHNGTVSDIYLTGPAVTVAEGQLFLQ